MTNLECSALHCANNHSHLCCLSEINVGGANACRCSETCCESFVDSGNSYANVLDSRDAAPETRISCAAHHCVYNTSGICNAEDVQINGSFAHRRDATSCNTFIARD